MSWKLLAVGIFQANDERMFLVIFDFWLLFPLLIESRYSNYFKVGFLTEGTVVVFRMLIYVRFKTQPVIGDVSI